jgi:hypothetical protein
MQLYYIQLYLAILVISDLSKKKFNVDNVGMVKFIYA